MGQTCVLKLSKNKAGHNRAKAEKAPPLGDNGSSGTGLGRLTTSLLAKGTLSLGQCISAFNTHLLPLNRIAVSNTSYREEGSITLSRLLWVPEHHMPHCFIPLIKWHKMLPYLRGIKSKTGLCSGSGIQHSAAWTT